MGMGSTILQLPVGARQPSQALHPQYTLPHFSPACLPRLAHLNLSSRCRHFHHGYKSANERAQLRADLQAVQAGRLGEILRCGLLQRAQPATWCNMLVGWGAFLLLLLLLLLLLPPVSALLGAACCC